MSAFLSDTYPEVDNVCEVAALSRRGNTLTVDEKKIPEQLIIAADSTFFDFFDDDGLLIGHGVRLASSGYSPSAGGAPPGFWMASSRTANEGRRCPGTTLRANSMDTCGA